MIVLEGPDGGGKTTLLAQLQHAAKIKVNPKAVNSDGKGRVPLDEYVETQLGKGWRNLVFDRFALVSGPIYGQYTGMADPNRPFADRVWLTRMEALFLGLRPLIIYCLPSLPVIRTNLLRDPTSAGVVGNNLDGIYYAYQARAARDCAVGVGMVYDYENPEAFSIVLGRIRLRRQQEGIY
jgi:hypothetical protein